MEVKNISQSQVIRNSFWKFCESIGFQLLMLVITIILARLLTPKDYGMMAIIMIATNFLTLFVNSSIAGYLIYKRDIRKEDFLTAIVCNLCVALFLVAVLIIAARPIAVYYSSPALTPMIKAMSVIIPFSSVSSVYNAYAMKMSMFKTLFIRNIISAPISGILALFLAYSGFGVWALVWQQISYNILLAFIVILTIKIKIDGNWEIDITSLRDMWSFGSFTLIATIIAFISDSISDLVIGKRINASQLGLYSRGNQFPSTIFSSVNNVISNVFFPAFASYGHDIALLKEKCRKSIRIVYSLASPILFGLIGCASPMIRVLLTDKWAESIPIVQIICLYFLAIPFLQMTSQVLLAVGWVKLRMVGELVKMIVTFALLFYMVRYGIEGVAWSRVCVGWIMAAFTLTIIRFVMKYNLKEFISDLYKPIIASVIMTLLISLILYLPFSNLIILIIQVPAGIAVYFLISILINNYELFELMKQLILKIKSK